MADFGPIAKLNGAVIDLSRSTLNFYTPRRFRIIIGVDVKTGNQLTGHTRPLMRRKSEGRIEQLLRIWTHDPIMVWLIGVVNTFARNPDTMYRVEMFPGEE